MQEDYSVHKHLWRDFMKKVIVGFFLILGAALPWACSSSYTPSGPYSMGPTPTITNTKTVTPTRTITLTPTVTVTRTITNTPTVTSTPTATATVTSTPAIFVSTTFNTSAALDYSYTASGATVNADQSIALTANVGDVIQIDANSTHPLYFYKAGAGSCVVSGAESPFTYTFPASGTYYFHCGNHGNNCGGIGNNGNDTCTSTTCTAMAGVITVP
jgi:hypothetical protein